MPIRVLHIAKTAAPLTYGGLESTMRQICLGLADESFEFDVVCAGGSTPGVTTLEADYARVQVLRSRVRFSTCPVPEGFVDFLRAAARRYDVFHFHAVWPFAEMIDWLAVGRGPRRVVTYHADVLGREPFNSLYRPLLRRFLDRCDTVVATSRAYAQSSPVLSRLERPPQAIPLALNPHSYPAVEPSRVDEWRARLGVGFFLFLGMLRPYKGLDTLIAAAAGLPAPVVLAGDGPAMPDLKRRIAALGLDNVHLLGRVDERDKVALLQAARAVVLPSRTRAEAFGIALLEGQMFSRPLISTELGTATSEVNRHDVTGHVVPPGDVAALRAAMDALLDDGRAERMGQAARARFDACYRLGWVAGAYAALYRGEAGGTADTTPIAAG